MCVGISEYVVVLNPNLVQISAQWILFIVHEYLLATVSSSDTVSSPPAPPLLHPSLMLSCAHSLPLTLIDTEKHTDEVKMK